MSKQPFSPRFLARASLLLVAAALLTGPVCAQQGEEPPMTPAALQAALSDAASDKTRLAERIRAWCGADNLKKGPNPKTRDLMVAWAIEAPGVEKGREPVVVSTLSAPVQLRQRIGDVVSLQRVGESDVYAAVRTLPEGSAMRWAYRVNGAEKGGGRLEAYTAPPESKEQPGVPKGTLTRQPVWKSAIFPKTERDWWVYVPAQYKPENPACVMVFQDGIWIREYAARVFDNLIAKGEMPVTVGVFVNPGRFANQPPGQQGGNRRFEYDTLSDQYARFLLEEILPEVEKTVRLRHDAASRAISGESSGGICAFTVAWHRPDQFGKVNSWIGSFVNLGGGKTGFEGGHNYPPMIRSTRGKPKPIRVFLQDGANDIDNQFGNWPLANQEMAKALEFAGYDYKFVFGNGFHSGSHGRAIMPEMLRWLWRDYKPDSAITAVTGSAAARP